MIAIARQNVHPLVRDALIVILASLALNLSGYLTFHLPFSLVPITFQVSFALFLCALLGPKRGFFVVLAFLTQDVMGLSPTINPPTGLLRILGPTGGYLLGYLVGGVLTGVIAKKNPGRKGVFAAMCAGNLVVYLLGAAWLTQYTGSISVALLTGVAPFLVGDLFKNLMFSSLIKPRSASEAGV